jgi:hypothetical protein
MNDHINRLYAGCIGFTTGTLSYIQNTPLGGNFLSELIRTTIIATVSTLTGLIVRQIYVKTIKIILKDKINGK